MESGILGLRLRNIYVHFVECRMSQFYSIGTWDDVELWAFILFF